MSGEPKNRYGRPQADAVEYHDDGSASVEVTVPPPDERYQYRAAIAVSELGRSIELVVDIPHTDQRMAVETSIILRNDGPTPADLAYRERLYRLVGEAVVASGRIEAGLKRLILILEPSDRGFAAVDDMWQELERRLRTAASRAQDPFDELVEELRSILDVAAQRQLREVRNHLVHGYHWAFDIGHVRLSRFQRRQDPTQVVESEQSIRASVAAMSRFADDLERLAVPSWHVAFLPNAPPVPGAE